MYPTHYLRCLGAPGLYAPTGEQVKFRTRKHLALLIYLRIDGKRSYRRDHLASLLWPKVSIAEARHSLATALSSLRPRLAPGALRADREAVQLSESQVITDVSKLLRREVLGETSAEPLEIGEFLDGFDVPDSGEFSRWKDRQQARLLPAMKDALVMLIERARRTGDALQMEGLADRMMSLDDLSEEAVRAKMEARAFCGDRLTALQVFEHWRERLQASVGALPSSTLEGIATRLRRRGWERTTPSHIPTIPTDQWRGRHFVGRAPEYQALYEAWETVVAGQSCHAMILGDSGVGKTTLVQRFTTAAGLAGAAISRVQCYDVERHIPYATLCNVVQGLLECQGVSATPPDALAEIARVVPEVRRRFQGIPDPEESQGEAARIRLAEAFHQMLRAIMGDHPVILVMDDAHLADDASLAAIHLVMRRARTEQLMVIFVARPGELNDAPHASRLRENATSLGVREVPVPPLGGSEARQLLDSLFSGSGPEPDSSVRRTLLRAAGGYPLVLEFLAQDWIANGENSVGLKLDAMITDVGAAEMTPSVYRTVLDRTLSTLDPSTHNVLSLAAILGRRLNEPALYSLLDLTTGQTIVGLGELVSRRVLRDSGHGLEFVNEMVRGAAYLGVPSSLRTRLHGEIANQLIASEPRGVATIGLEIAWHCIRAGRVHEATPYLLRGAREARAQGALHEAERGLATALRHLAYPERNAAALLLAEVLQEEGLWLQSLAVLETEVSSLDDNEAKLAFALSVLARFRIRGSGFSSTMADVSELLATASTAVAAHTSITATRVAATLCGDLRDRALARRVLDLVNSIHVAALPPDQVLQVVATRAFLLFQLRDLRASLEEVEYATELLSRENAVSSTACELRAGLGALKSLQGDYAGAIKHLHESYDMATLLDNDTLRSHLAANLSLTYGRVGEYVRQLEWATESTALAPASLTSYTQVLSAYCAAHAWAMQGHQRKGAELIAQTDARMPGALPGWALQAWLLYSADVLLLCGLRESAEGVGRRATTSENSSLHSPSFAGVFCRWKAQLAKGPESLAQARKLLLEYREHLDEYDMLDQAEILSAVAHVNAKLSVHEVEVETRLASTFSRLPLAVHQQLVRLGFLDTATHGRTTGRGVKPDALATNLPPAS